MVRLFVAVLPPDDVLVELENLHRKDQPGVRFVPPENWHVTLEFLGDASAADAAGHLTHFFDSRPGRVRCRLGPVVDLLGDHAVIVDADGLNDLANGIQAAVRGVGDAPRRQRYRGHLTLARIHQKARGRQPGRRLGPPPIVGTPFNADFEVDAIHLMQSRLGSGGARYEIVETWPLL